MLRIKELDFLKGVLILLVISFHLVWFEQLHPDIKQVVYCFHMPGFLFMSGYLMNISKPPRQFLRTLLWLAVPYLFMASGYIYVASLLPIADHIDCLTPTVFLDRLLLHPLGPPWFLHALILCGATYYIIFHIKTLSNFHLKGEDSEHKASPLRGGWEGSFSSVSQVTFAQLSEAEIEHYVTHYHPLDKAGAYGIQEWIGMIGVSRIEGCFYNVMGLPVARLYAALNELVK